MAIEQTPSGATIITGEHIDLFALISMKKRLQLEMRGFKFRVNTLTATQRRGYTRAKNRKGALADIEKLIAEFSPKQ